MIRDWGDVLVVFVWMTAAYVYGRDDGERDEYIRGITLLIVFVTIAAVRYFTKGF